MGDQIEPDEDEGDGLSNTEYLLYSILFVVIPGACVIVSSILYYVWRQDRPRRANQINVLGFVVVGIQVGIYLLFTKVLVPR